MRSQDENVLTKPEGIQNDTDLYFSAERLASEEEQNFHEKDRNHLAVDFYYDDDLSGSHFDIDAE